MKKKLALLTLVLSVVVVVLSLIVFVLAYTSGQRAPYICHFSYDTSKYSQCRVFTQTGIAPIQVNSQGRIVEDLILQGAPVGSNALWLANNNGTIIVTFPNSTTVTCNILHAKHGPCIIGMA